MTYRRIDPCTCGPRFVHPTDIDPPEWKVDRNCPEHGVDPDRLREDRDDQCGCESEVTFSDDTDYSEQRFRQ